MLSTVGPKTWMPKKGQGWLKKKLTFNEKAESLYVSFMWIII